MAAPIETPWLSSAEASAYCRRGRRHLRAAVRAGKLRAAVVGGKRELLFRREWLDQFLEDQATPIKVLPGRRTA